MQNSREITFKLHKTVFLMDKLADRLLQNEQGITSSQFRILMAINHHQDISQKDIARFWEMTEAAISRQIDTLIDKKLLTRRENKQNRSKNALSLTEIGLSHLDKGFKNIDDNFEKIYKQLNQTEKKIIGRGLAKLLSGLCVTNQKIKKNG